MNHIILQIRKDLEKNIDDKIKKSGQNFFKEKVKIYGIKTSIVSKIGKKYFISIKDKSKKEILDLCDELWRSGYIEESFIACNWSYYIHKDYEVKDLKVFERWLDDYVNNWASCDTLCNHTVGAFLEMYPVYVSELKKWAKSINRWKRRAAAVSLIIPAKQGKFLRDIFEIADILLTDQDDLVQKGYGWMLKAASQTHQEQVFDYVMKNKKMMPRTALRYAIEKIPKDLRNQAIAR
ncbi:hypothetical protein METP3_01403 [Methanosarcinales archaeon]|nr:hypothetical protein METP3_01403 [Methanosarcinales archaeon]